MIAHRLMTVRNADRIYVLDRGQVIEEGNHETLIVKGGGKYREMVNKQVLEEINDIQHTTRIKTQLEEDEKQICRHIFYFDFFLKMIVFLQANGSALPVSIKIRMSTRYSCAYNH